MSEYRVDCIYLACWAASCAVLLWNLCNLTATLNSCKQVPLVSVQVTSVQSCWISNHPSSPIAGLILIVLSCPFSNSLIAVYMVCPLPFILRTTTLVVTGPRSACHLCGRVGISTKALQNSWSNTIIDTLYLLSLMSISTPQACSPTHSR